MYTEKDKGVEKLIKVLKIVKRNKQCLSNQKIAVNNYKSTTSTQILQDGIKRNTKQNTSFFKNIFILLLIVLFIFIIHSIIQ